MRVALPTANARGRPSVYCGQACRREAERLRTNGFYANAVEGVERTLARLRRDGYDAYIPCAQERLRIARAQLRAHERRVARLDAAAPRLSRPASPGDGRLVVLPARPATARNGSSA
jgi:hypothetical protein